MGRSNSSHSSSPKRNKKQKEKKKYRQHKNKSIQRQRSRAKDSKKDVQVKKDKTTILQKNKQRPISSSSSDIDETPKKKQKPSENIKKRQSRQKSKDKDHGQRKNKDKKSKRQRNQRDSRNSREKETNKKRSRSRSEKRQKKQRSRSRDKKRKRSNQRLQQLNKEKKQQKTAKILQQDLLQLIDDDYRVKKKSQTTNEDQSRMFARRKVRARLLKLNQLLEGQNSSSSQQQKAVQAKPQNIPAPLAVVKKDRRQSKWGKTSTNQQPSILPLASSADIALDGSKKGLGKGLSLQIQASDDQLKLSQDKSIQIQNQHFPPQPLQTINQQQIDPLDMYMNQIQVQAVQQMDLPTRNDKKNTIAFEDIVVQTVTQPELLSSTQRKLEQSDQQTEQEFRKKFLEAISKIDDKQDDFEKQKGDLMENNEDKKSDISFHQQKEPQLDFFAKQRKMAQRKQLNQVDHAKVHYEQVRFDLYREADQVKNMDPKQAVKYRKEAGDIKIRGRNILNPVFNWYYCGFNDRILAVIQRRNYDKPFPIQAQSIPMIMSGRDVVGIAETGSGKTLAYLLPMLKHVMQQRRVQQGEGPIGLIMTPTRQLARQVYLEAKTFCKMLNVRVLPVYGGLSVQEQLSGFRKGVQIVICTPGRMIDILTLNKGRITNLQRVTMIVIDQADRMFDLGFEPQISKIMDNVRPKRQTVMFSATFPKNVQMLARRILNYPVEIIVGSRGQACRNVTQQIEVRAETSKFLRLLEILGIWSQKGKTLIFVDKQTEADYLFQQLLKYGYQAIVLHGAMDPDDRQHNIYDFKKGVNGLNIMIATSVCARGLDIKQIVLVVNFKCPNHLEDYIHRIGRTGRAGNKGTAITFITPGEEQYSIDLLKALEMSEVQPPEELIKLSQQYLQKVKKGQARKIRNRNIQGSGFKFDQEEEQKNSMIKSQIKKQLKNQGLGGFDSDEQDDLQIKKKKEEEYRGRNQQEKIAEAIKNPETKNRLLNQAAKAVQQAIKNGAAMNTQKLLQIAKKTMLETVAKQRVVRTVDDGVEQVTKLFNQFQNKGGDNTNSGIDFFSYDFQINDYPNNARQRACNKQFLHSIQQLTNCSISLRGTYVQPGKKVPIGMRKLYLHIQGQNKHYVSTAYKEIKQVIEENAYQSMHMGSMPGKYKI